MAYRLIPDIKNYDWGSSDSLSRFFHLAKTGLPEAEAWLGKHELAATQIVDGSSTLPLGDWLTRKGSPFDVLVKVLAARNPLSIQVHPNSEQARIGYDREQELINSGEQFPRVFKDSRPKPELIIALAPNFRVLVGFVSDALLRRRLKALSDSGEMLFAAGSPAVSFGEPAEYVDWVLQGSPEVREFSVSVNRYIVGLHHWTQWENLGCDRESLEHIVRAHPDDPGVLLAMAMHHVVLPEGEGLFVPPGVVHAYMEGLGLEVMLPSDNVVRAGLTTKPKHPELFMAVANLKPTDSPFLVSPAFHEGTLRYDSSEIPFVIRVLEGSSPPLTATEESIVIVERGKAEWVDQPDKEVLEAGHAFFADKGETIRATDFASRVWVVSGKPKSRST